MNKYKKDNRIQKKLRKTNNKKGEKTQNEISIRKAIKVGNDIND